MRVFIANTAGDYKQRWMSLAIIEYVNIAGA